MRLLVCLAATAVLAAPVAANAAPARDRHAPLVAITTPHGSVMPPPPLGRVEGHAGDDASGIARVEVDYCGPASHPHGGDACGDGSAVLSHVESVDADLACRPGARRVCGWSAPVPLRPGTYLVVAIAWDRIGKRAGAGPIDILVV